ncbi:MAG: TRAP transporter small permease [Candidatus Parabeggiatoa sp.]|nr:TRAP transporter small permease [Candidatus Parabeggiatoa sp.]
MTQRITQFVNQLEESLIALLLAAMTLITFSQVVARYFFNGGFVWALELNTYLFAWLILLGMSYGVRVGAHIGIDAITRLLPKNGQQVLAILATLLCLAYCVLLFIGGIQYVSLIYDLGIQAEDLPIRQWIPYSILPIGLALLCFRFAQVLFKLITKPTKEML